MAYSPNLNKTSTDNSSTSTLTTGTTYTGTWEDASNYDSIVVSVKTDQNGIFYVDFSPDGSNTDSTLTRYYNTTDIEAPHRFTVTRKYYRIRFTNDSGSNQTYFRLQTILKKTAQNLNIPIDAVAARDYDATIVRPTDHDDEVSLGLRQGVISWNKWGYNSDVDTGSEETICAFGGRLTPLTSASTFTITYDGTGGGSTDGASTTGATKLGFWYVDSNRVQTYAEHTLGTDGSDETAFSGLGINRLKVIEAGSNKVNNSVITVTATTGGTTQASIPAGDGVTQQGFFFTAADSQGLADWLHLNMLKVGVGSQPVVTVRAWVHDFVNNVIANVFEVAVDTSVENTLELTPPEAFLIPPSALIEFTASTDVDNTKVTIRFNLKEYKNVDAD